MTFCRQSHTIASSMSATRYFQTEPCLALRPWVEHLWLFETFETDERLNDSYLVLPDGRIDILFRAKRGGRCEIDLVGTMTKAQHVRSDCSAYVGVRFRPGAATAALRLELSELTNSSTPLGNHWPPVADELLDRLATVHRATERLSQLEAVLVRLIPAFAEPDRCLQAAIARLEDTHGLESVNRLSQLVNLSPRQLQRRFNAQVGVGPKRFAQIVRFQEAHRLIARGRPAVEVAAEVGYADQSHLVHEFRLLSGFSPSELMTQL
jgi:AraC-like DNA-binding protein